MKKLAATLLVLICTSIHSSFGQVPGITYQAVILSSDSKALPGINHTNIPLADQDVCLQFSFLNQAGDYEYQEVIQTKTDPLGMVNVIIGKGNQVGGSAASFDKIPWSIAAKFLEVSLDKSGTCTEFNLISKQEFTAVPFALFSVNSGALDSEITQGKSAYQIWIDLGNVGTEQDFLKSLKGPTGPQGPIGATGAAGQTGATGPVGAAGTNGLSAYQVWLELGNTGTEANFIASLSGPSGPQGPAGVAGVAGPQGAAGQTGATGPAGAAGTDGVSAYQVWLGLGNTGTEANFIASLTGPSGPQGPAGVAGVAGPQGAIGPVGPQGPAGADGVAASAATFVDLSTNQSIGGTKTFTNPIAGSITGNAATVTTNANLTGEVTSAGNTATLSNSAVIGQVLTGFTSGAGAVSATDNILQALQKVDGNVSAANSSVAGKQDQLTNSAGLSGALSDETGTGLAVFNTSPTLVTPNLGTPSALVGTNITGTAPGLTAGRVTTNADLTGVVTSSGNVTAITNGVITNAMLANGAVANLSGTNTGDQTATTVSNTSAGTIAATTVQGALNELDTEKAPLASPTFTGAPTLPTGTIAVTQNPSDNSTAVATTAYADAAANASVSGKQNLLTNSAGLSGALSDETGTGLAVFNTSPTLVTPNLGIPSAAVLTNATGLPLSSGVSGTLPVANGGTGLTAVGTNGQVLTTNSSGALTWSTPSGTSAGTEQGQILKWNGSSWAPTGSQSLSIGFNAGGGIIPSLFQGTKSIAIGYEAGTNKQSSYSIAIGEGAGKLTQGSSAVAIGRRAGLDTQGSYAVAIGYYAGYQDQPSNSIAINATNLALNPTNNGFFVNPINSISSSNSNFLTYNTVTKEINYATSLVADAGILSGTTLNSTVTASSLTSVGALTNLTVNGTGNFTNLNVGGTSLSFITHSSGTTTINSGNHIISPGSSGVILELETAPMPTNGTFLIIYSPSSSFTLSQSGTNAQISNNTTTVCIYTGSSWVVYTNGVVVSFI